MILAAGAILQSGKYVIQAVLHQTDLGVTYQAYHVYLNQPVVLQALNPGDAAGQQFNFSQLRQQFIQQARELAKYPSNHRLRAIDLFEEKIEQQSLPFVVLSFFRNQPPQKIGEWFAVLPEPMPKAETAAIAAPTTAAPTVAVPKADTASESAASQAGPLAESLNGAKNVNGARDEAKNGAKATQAVLVSGSTVSGSTVSGSNAPAAQPSEAAIASAASSTSPATATLPPAAGTSGTASVSRPHSPNPVRVYVQPQRRSLNLFLLTALIAGAAGAGMGFALRVHPAPQTKAPFNLGNGLFTREQSFPAEGNWPIHETPQVMMPESAVEQPSYSTKPALQYQPPIEPFPSTGYAPLPAEPVQPVPRPTSSQEAIENNSAPATPELESPVRLPPAASDVPPKPAPIAPAPAPAPPIPDPPAAVAPPPAPAIDPAPAAPAPAPPLRPQTVDQ